MALALLRLAVIGASTGGGLAAGWALAPPGHRVWLAAAGAGVGLAAVLVVALARREALAAPATATATGPAARGETTKILDTSAIIDGRIAEVCEAGFLDGPLLVPEFVLRELQQVADSPDPLRRNRGKRGFEVLQRLQRLPGARVRLDGRDVPGVAEVDRKLVELARSTGAKVVTNDYNLSKVAELSGVAALNVNELANALRPVALPGETLHLHVLREGKEAGQGVAYLDDGTMVVVDHGRRLVGQTVDVTVTSVLQTSAGRMIFARPAPPAPQATPEEKVGR